MYEDSVCDIELVPVTFWPPALARRVVAVICQAVTMLLVGFSLFGIAMGFSAMSDQDGPLQSALYSVAQFTGLVG